MARPNDDKQKRKAEAWAKRNAEILALLEAARPALEVEQSADSMLEELVKNTLPGNGGSAARRTKNDPRVFEFILRVANEPTFDRQQSLLADAAHRNVFVGHRLGDLERYFEVLEEAAQANAEAAAGVKSGAAPTIGLEELRRQCVGILEAEDPLELIGKELQRLKYGGELDPPKALYVAWTTRLLPRRRGSLPAHTQTNGSSGGGKSYSNDLVRDLHPPEAYVERTATSPKQLLHDNESLKHRVLYYTQANSLPGVSTGGKYRNDDESAVAGFFLELLQRGQAVYSYLVRDPETGEQVTVHKVREGPTVLVTTMVKRLGADEMDTRLNTLDWPEDREQHYAALMAQADLEDEEAVPEPRPEFVAFQRYLQALAPIDVYVPFVRAFSAVLHENQKDMDPRIMRDVARLKSLIKGIAILRMEHRERTKTGRVIATRADYETMVKLATEMYKTTSGVSKALRRLVEAVPEHRCITVTELAKFLGKSQPAVSKSAAFKTALKEKYIINAEERRGYAYMLQRGEPLAHQNGLPSWAQIEAWKPRTPRTPLTRTDTDTKNGL
jgi:hypothetical protein